MSALQPGSAVEKYVVRAVLGAGGMATVYVVEHTVLGSLHALKLLQQVNPEIRRRLIREGRVQARLDHPHVVPVQDVLDIDGRPGLLMPLVEGPDLGRLLAHHGALPTAAAAHLFREIVLGVDYAHQHGVVHRDLKPGNVLLDVRHRALVARVADFGLATAGDGEVSGETRTGIFMGTPAYAAPEQFADAASVDHRADLWSLGCILYHLLAGHPPFAGSLHELVRRIGTAERVPLGELAPGLDPAWHGLVADLLVVDRDARLADTGALLDRLDGLVDRADTQALSGDLLDEARALHAADHGVASADATVDSGRPWSGSLFAATATSLPRGVAETVASQPTLGPAETPSIGEEKPRRRAVVVAVGVVVALAAGGWLFATRGPAAPVTYEDVVWTASGWHGVGALPDERGGGYRVRTTSDGGQEVTRLDAAGRPTQFERIEWGVVRRPRIEPRAESGLPCSELIGSFCQGINELGEPPTVTTQVVRRADDGRVAEVEERDAWGNLLGRIDVDPIEGGLRLRHLTPGGLPVPNTALEVAVEDHFYDEAGRLERTAWYDVGGEQVIRASDGSLGHLRRYDAEGRLVSLVLADAKGAPVRGIGNVSSTEWTYGDPAHAGLPTEVRSLGPAGIPIAGTSGCDIIRLAWTEAGEVSEQRCEASDGSILRFAGTGCGVLKWAPTDTGRVVSCLDASGAATGVDGWSSLEFEYDDDGALVGLRNLDTEGRQFGDVWGIGRYRFERDERGILVRVGPHEDARGEPLAIPGLFATWRRTLVNGLETHRVAIDADGQPAELGLGWVARTLVRDHFGAVTEVAWFDASGAPALAGQGFHRRVWEYDERGGLVAMKVFGPDGEPAIHRLGGAHMVRYERDAAGRLISDPHFDVNGRPMLRRAVGKAPKDAELGYHMGRATRDGMGRVVRVDFLDTEGNPVVSSKGHASDVRTYDAFGRVTSTRFLDAEGKPTKSSDGAAGYDQEWGPRPDEPYPSALRWFDENGLLAAPQRHEYSNNCASQRFRVLAIDGPMIEVETRCFGPSGNRVVGQLGVHREVNWRAPTGRRFALASRTTRMEHYGVDDEPVESRFGFFAMEREYDALGRIVEVRAYPVPGGPPPRIARMRNTYDARGEIVRTAFFGGDGELVDPGPSDPSPNRHAVTEREFDDLGRLVEKRWIRADGGWGGNGEAPRERYAYDQAVRGESGWSPTRIAFHDEAGDAMEVDGIAARTFTYDRLGQTVREATWSAAGVLANDARGIAMVEQEWDPRGLRTTARYTDARRAPAKGPEGCAEWAATYDDLGHQTTETCDGVSRPVVEGG